MGPFFWEKLSMNQNEKEILCTIDLDVMERIKREAHHKKVSHKILLNQILREAVFKNKKTRKQEKILERPFCPDCGFDLLKGKSHKDKKKVDEETTKKLKSIKNLFGLLG